MEPVNQDQWIKSLSDSVRTKEFLSHQQPRNLWDRWRQGRQMAQLHKSVGEKALKWGEEIMEAQEQNAVVNPAMYLMGLYDTLSGVREKTFVTFEVLRGFEATCEPVAAIINRRVYQVASYATIPDVQLGFVKEPGFRIRMTSREAKATRENRKEIQELEQFLLEGGFCSPPKHERPDNWQPGFGPFLSQFTRDSLTMDWVAVRFWKPEDKLIAKKWPIACFACEDAARVRRVKPKVQRVTDGKVEFEEWVGERKNNREEKEYVMVNAGGSGGSIESEFTSDEMRHYIRTPRTDRIANGYGYSELERAINSIFGWLWARDYNLSRFRSDSLPRGILYLQGQIGEQQLQAFRMEWRQMLQGVAKRWFMPMLHATSTGGAPVGYIPLDNSSRDMEYHQMMFLLAVMLHGLYGIHPEETGYQAISPYRPPLSESSPEAEMKYAQDWGLRPLLKHIETFVNRNIVWRVYPDRRYTFEFVGVGEYMEAEQVGIWLQELEGGLNTPGNIWDRRDMEIPDLVKDHPAWHLPMPFAKGLEYIDNLQAQEQQAQVAQQQAQMQQVQQSMPQQGMGGTGMPQSPLPPEMQKSLLTRRQQGRRVVIVKRRQHAMR